MHPAGGVALGHLLVENAAPGGHPLHAAGAEHAAIAEAVAVSDAARKHVGDRLDAAMGMPRKTRAIVAGIVAAKVVHQQERIELGRVSETERPAEPHARALQGGPGFGDRFDGTDRHGSFFR